jgi:hypothetical protein
MCEGRSWEEKDWVEKKKIRMGTREKGLKRRK